MTFTKNSRWTTASMTFSPSGLPDTLPGEIPSRGRSQPNGLLLWFQNVTEGCNRMKQVYDAFCDKLWQHTWISKSLSQQCLHPVPRVLKTGGWKCARHRGSCAAFDCQASHCTLTCQDISPRCGNIEQCFSGLPLVCEWKELVLCSPSICFRRVKPGPAEWTSALVPKCHWRLQ